LEGIRAIVLKGAHLATLICPRPELRPMSDIDLLLSQTDLQRARLVLHEMGYRGDEQDDKSRASHIPPLSKTFHPRVELHWRLDEMQPQSHEEDIWNRSRQVFVAGESARVLCPEDLIVHLCLHGAGHHQFSCGGKLFMDLHYILKRHGDEIRWDALNQTARDWNASKSLHLTFHLGRKMAGLSIPDELAKPLTQAELARWESVGTRLLARTGEPVTTDVAQNRQTLLHFAAVPWRWTRHGTVRGVAQMMFPSQAYMAHYMEVHHGASISAGVNRWTCYPRRWLDWSIKGERLIWNTITRSQEMIASARDLQDASALRAWLQNSQDRCI
jgi:hypothetical protein